MFEIFNIFLFCLQGRHEDDERVRVSSTTKTIYLEHNCYNVMSFNSKHK